MGKIDVKQARTKQVSVPVRWDDSPKYNFTKAKNAFRDELRRLWREFRQARLALKIAKLDYKMRRLR